jgi:hypothetical protein
MLYTKIKDVKTPSVDEDSKSNDDNNHQDILQYYCKNCKWSTDETAEDLNNNHNCIYRRNYQEDYIVERVIANKYTIFDNTLPRVTYDCINTDCPTNQDNSNFNENNSLIIENLPPDYTDEQIANIFSSDIDKIYKAIRVKLTKYMILFNTEVDKQLFQERYNNFEENEYKLKISQYEKPKKEVLYIKYDSINMKYLYICANCGTSWKKN